jgi:hypothetical protein
MHYPTPHIPCSSLAIPKICIAIRRMRKPQQTERVTQVPGKPMKDRTQMTKTVAHVGTAAIAGVLCVATGMAASAAGLRSPTAMTPLMATSFDVGSKHVVGYFLRADGQCKLTLMIADAARDEDSEPSTHILRLRLLVEPGQSARVDAIDGRLIQYSCERDAEAMNATLLDQIAAGRDSK